MRPVGVAEQVDADGSAAHRGSLARTEELVAAALTSDKEYVADVL